MESIIRNVKDIDPGQRRLYESLLGKELHENQQLIIQVISLDEGDASAKPDVPAGQQGQLPDWCNVYEGLPDDEIAELETAILDRKPWTRSSH